MRAWKPCWTADIQRYLCIRLKKSRKKRSTRRCASVAWFIWIYLNKINLYSSKGASQPYNHRPKRLGRHPTKHPLVFAGPPLGRSSIPPAPPQIRRLGRGSLPWCRSSTLPHSARHRSFTGSTRPAFLTAPSPRWISARRGVYLCRRHDCRCPGWCLAGRDPRASALSFGPASNSFPVSVFSFLSVWCYFSAPQEIYSGASRSSYLFNA